MASAGVWRSLIDTVTQQERHDCLTTGRIPPRFEFSYKTMRELDYPEADFTMELHRMKIFSVDSIRMSSEFHIVLFRRYLLCREPGSLKTLVPLIRWNDVPSAGGTFVRYPDMDEFLTPPGYTYCGKPRRVNWDAVNEFQESISEYVFELACAKHLDVWGVKHPKLVALEQKEERAKARKRSKYFE